MIFGYTIYNQQYIHIIFYNDNGTVRIMNISPTILRVITGIYEDVSPTFKNKNLMYLKFAQHSCNEENDQPG